MKLLAQFQLHCRRRRGCRRRRRRRRCHRRCCCRHCWVVVVIVGAAAAASIGPFSLPLAAEFALLCWPPQTVQNEPPGTLQCRCTSHMNTAAEPGLWSTQIVPCRLTFGTEHFVGGRHALALTALFLQDRLDSTRSSSAVTGRQGVTPPLFRRGATHNDRLLKGK